jgi:hypothetical protein
MKAKYRRSRTRPLARGLVAVGAGGAVLILPLLAATTANAATSEHVVKTSVSAHRAAPETYVVVPGDSLSKIAFDHHLRGGWQRLYRENREAVGPNPSLIHPGLKLELGGNFWHHNGKSWHGKKREATAPSSPAQPGAAAGKSAPAAPKPAPAAPESTKTEVTNAAAAKPAAQQVYPNNLDGWIRESLAIMAQRGIPGTYNGIYRNIMRESGGNPNAINLWDSNAAKGTPSKGLLQVIAPTFEAYHVPGTSFNPYDPVANITAACNYAFHRYGSIDNVFGPY